MKLREVELQSREGKKNFYHTDFDKINLSSSVQHVPFKFSSFVYSFRNYFFKYNPFNCTLYRNSKLF